MGFLAMTLDVGSGNQQRRKAQTAADAAALEGAAEIYRHVTDAGAIQNAALGEAQRNGFDDASADVVVTVCYNPGPCTGPHAGDPAYVEVTIEKTIPSIFGNIFNIASMQVRTRAVAGVSSHSLNCIYSLDPSAAQAIEVKNGGKIETNCGITLNSTDDNALDVNQSGDVDTNGGGVAVAGGWSGNKAPEPAPSTGTAAIDDPLKDLAVPTVGPCTQVGPMSITGTVNLAPGVYCGKVLVTNSGVANLSAGLFVFKGGLEIVSSGQLYGTNVTLYNTYDATYTYGPINFGNGCKTQLVAPTSGAYKGIIMMQDPTAPAGVVNTIACTAIEPEFTGTLYFPTQQITFGSITGGGGGSNSNTVISGTVIAGKVLVNGDLTMMNQTSGSSAIQRFSLVE
jgi:hypothetical protein